MADEFEDSGPALTLPPSWDTDAMLFSHVRRCARCKFVLLLGWCHHRRRRMRRGDPGE